MLWLLREGRYFLTPMLLVTSDSATQSVSKDASSLQAQKGLDLYLNFAIIYDM